MIFSVYFVVNRWHLRWNPRDVEKRERHYLILQDASCFCRKQAFYAQKVESNDVAFTFLHRTKLPAVQNVAKLFSPMFSKGFAS